MNYAADGGLYAELIQNRSFEYSARDNGDWNFLTGWEIVQHNGDCAVALGSAEPLHPNNPHYLVLHIAAAQGQAGIRNHGYGGIALHAGEEVEFSCFVRLLSDAIGPTCVQLLGRKGALLAEAEISAPTPTWQRVSVTLRSCADDPFSSCSVLFSGIGTLALDMVSLFPCKTFRNRPNGLRADLAQAIADLKPRFLRFPGGCLVHGDGLDNMYRWQETIGPLETRRAQPNIWHYHQSAGLGYFEYFQFCRDIGAKPLPVVPAGVCCQNSEARWTGAWGAGQQGLPLEEMPNYIQEVLDLIEWANGPVESTWGAKRAAAGHPEPFGLEYLGVGNEEHITPLFRERFAAIHAAVRAAHPEITVIGTVGPAPEGTDHEEGWKLAQALACAVVDEHEYGSPDWHWENLARYDGYDRASAQVYLGEYAAHDWGRRNTWRAALAEAAFMTALERNGDIVCMASYAPLLGKRGHTQWLPDLIYFDNQAVCPSLNYTVQQVFSHNAGDAALPLTIDRATDAHGRTILVASCVRESSSGDLVIKLVSRAETSIHAQIALGEESVFQPTASCTVLAGDPQAENKFSELPAITPVHLNLAIAEQFGLVLPAHSITLIRIYSAT